MAKETRIFIRISRDEHQAAMAVAAARGSTISDEVRKFLARLVKREAAKAEMQE